VAAANDGERLGFLEIIDALVRRDGAATGLSGEVCIGVRDGPTYQWWSARLGPTFSTRFLSSPSQSAHATLFIAKRDADALLETGAIPDPPELFMIDGARDLMLRFFKRYTSKTTWLGVRLGR
jgi:hypothetical protein